MSDKAQELQQLISLSQEMLVNAQNELWDEVIALEEVRREQLRQFFSAPVEQAYTESVAAGIEQILTLDKMLVELGAVKKYDLAQALQGLEQGKKAVKAYSS